MIDFTQMTIHGLRDLLKNGEITSVELVESLLARVDALDDKIKSFIRIDREAALAMAKESDCRRATNSELSPYDGIPIGIKDCICVKDDYVSCASQILEPVVSPYDSTAVSRLKAKGFIPFGRLNMDEFAMGSSCENSSFQKTANPFDLERVPGGSSGGSAASVAARLVPAALGSDTGGSIRQPAAFCGIVGVKPTYGLVSRYGLVAFASSLDQIGPMTLDVEDSAIILETIAGNDKMDSTSLPIENNTLDYSSIFSKLPDNLNGVKVGIPKEYFEADGLAPAVKQAALDAVEKLKKLGAEIVNIELPHTKYAVAVYYIIATAEASANLARFDGIRYGRRVEGKDLVDTYFASRGQGFGEEVQRRILLGTYVLSSGYYDAYYLKAQKVRTLIRRDFEKAAELCDVIFTPVTPDVAFKFGAKSDPLSMYLSDIFTIALNLSGNCGLSLPVALDSESGMPIGMQFIAPALQERKLFEVAGVFEKYGVGAKFAPAE
ncbi:MAG: Asp-tRNA(Asn)/Glu-tRNA(Gln) amidotransferase subunit GatA [Lentisphaeria bacterium]|nr:Asp-tRNA(Asn)/Glu-tRNA(Gln) amidotransferase subunit GatA [Lentisphaeria bacterium]